MNFSAFDKLGDTFVSAGVIAALGLAAESYCTLVTNMQKYGDESSRLVAFTGHELIVETMSLVKITTDKFDEALARIDSIKDFLEEHI